MIWLAASLAARAQNVAMCRWGESGDPLSGLRVRALYMRGVSRGWGREVTQPERTGSRTCQHARNDTHSLDRVATRGAPSHNAEYRDQRTRNPKRGGFHVAAYILSLKD